MIDFYSYYDRQTAKCWLLAAFISLQDEFTSSRALCEVLKLPRFVLDPLVVRPCGRMF